MFFRQKLSRFGAVGIFVALLVATAIFAKDKPGTLLLWSFDLRGVGYRTDAPNPEYVEQMHRSSGILFVDASKVLAYFVDINPKHQLQRRSENNRFQLHLLLLDAENAHVLASESVPTTLGQSQVFISSNGHILVLAANVLRCYSSSLQSISEEALPTAGTGDSWIGAVSPSGKTLLLIHPDPIGGIADVLARSADDLRTIRAWRQRGGFRIACLDEYVYERSSDQLGPAVLVRIDANEWTVVNPRMTKPGSWTVSGVAGERIMFLSSQGLFLGDTFGDMQELGALPKGFTPAIGSSSSRDGSVAAVPLIRYQLRPFALPKTLEFRVKLFDLPKRRPTAELSLKPLTASSVIRVALSPDGDRLAAMNGYMVSVHAIGDTARRQQ